MRESNDHDVVSLKDWKAKHPPGGERTEAPVSGGVPVKLVYHQCLDWEMRSLSLRGTYRLLDNGCISCNCCGRVVPAVWAYLDPQPDGPDPGEPQEWDDTPPKKEGAA